MASSQLLVSVVIATRNRPDRLAAALAALRAQTTSQQDFEVVVVDDGSDDPRVGAVLDEAIAASGGAVRAIRLQAPEGTSNARNRGWRSSQAALIAFTDDDCEVTPGWLAGALAAWDGTDAEFVQGPTAPIPRERDRLGVFSYTIDVPEMSAEFQTCNIFYPRALLDRLDGFDAVTHPTSGEDTDLAWRAIAAGAQPRFAAGALSHHAVVESSPRGLLKRAWHFSDAIIPFGKHPELRRRRLIMRVFWNWSHYLLLRGVVALLLPRRLWPVSIWLAFPLVRFEVQRARNHGGDIRHVPWYVLYDSVEVAAVIRGAARGRTVVL